MVIDRGGRKGRDSNQSRGNYRNQICLGTRKKIKYEVEMYRVLQGLLMIKIKGVMDLIILGDSLLLIQFLINRRNPKGNTLNKLI